jgi:hypothetical protein
MTRALAAKGVRVIVFFLFFFCFFLFCFFCFCFCFFLSRAGVFFHPPSQFSPLPGSLPNLNALQGYTTRQRRCSDPENECPFRAMVRRRGGKESFEVSLCIARLHVASPASHLGSATHVRACSRAPQELHVGHEDEERRHQEKDVLQRRHHHDARDPLPRRGCEQPLGTAGASSPLVIFTHEIFGFPKKTWQERIKI